MRWLLGFTTQHTFLKLNIDFTAQMKVEGKYLVSDCWQTAAAAETVDRLSCFVKPVSLLVFR